MGGDIRLAGGQLDPRVFRSLPHGLVGNPMVLEIAVAVDATPARRGAAPAPVGVFDVFKAALNNP